MVYEAPIIEIAPLAKLLLQRKRRAEKGHKNPKMPFSPVELTPGTTLMRKIEQACYYYACQILTTRKEFQNIEVIISNSRVPGEGEVKIIEEILRNSKKNERNHLIVANDSDLFLLAILSQVQNISIVQGKNLFNIENLKFKIRNFLGIRSPLYDHTIASDFAFLCFFSGNDFIPKINDCPEFSELWDIYRSVLHKHKEFLISEDLSMNFKFLQDLMYNIMKRAKSKKTTINKNTNNSNSSDSSDRSDNSNSSDWSNNSNSSDWSDSSDTSTPIPLVYLTSCMWNFKMYYYGKCQDYNFFYPYLSGPSSGEIQKYLHGNKNSEICGNKNTELCGEFRTEKSFPLLPFQTLMVTIPPHMGELLPHVLQPIFSDFCNCSSSGKNDEFDQYWNPVQPKDKIPVLLEFLNLVGVVPEELYSVKEQEYLTFSEPYCYKKKNSKLVKEHDTWINIETPPGMSNLPNLPSQVTCQVLKRDHIDLRRKNRDYLIMEKITVNTKNKKRKRKDNKKGNNNHKRQKLTK